MKKNALKTLGFSFFLALSTFAPTTFAADKKSEPEKIDVTQASDETDDIDLAVIYNLGEICPGLIGKDLKFNKAYETLVKAHLNNEANAVEILNKRAKTKDFQKPLKEARAISKAASDEDNRQICDSVRNYYSK